MANPEADLIGGADDTEVDGADGRVIGFGLGAAEAGGTGEAEALGVEPSGLGEDVPTF